MTDITQEAVKTFTDKQWEVWNLVMRNFYTQREAAKMLHISISALECRLRMAKKKFRAYVKEHK